MTAIRTEGLVRRFGDRVALRGLDLRVPAGGIYVLIGRNGAGKTTTLNVLLGLLRPDAGTVRVLGAEPWTQAARVKARVGYLPESSALGYPWMTAQRALAFHASYHPAWDPGYERSLAEALEVPVGVPLAQLSKGQARSVQLVMALAHRPPLLLLDEPTDGLDPVLRDRALEILADFAGSGDATLLLSTHQIHEAERLADHVGILGRGQLMVQHSRAELRERLRSYRARVPEGWREPAELGVRVWARNRSAAEIEWRIWGDSDRVVAELSAAGATVREVSDLPLEEAARTILSAQGGRNGDG